MEAFGRFNKVISFIGSGLFLAGEVAYVFGKDDLSTYLYIVCAIFFLLYSVTDWVEFEIDACVERRIKKQIQLTHPALISISA